MQIIIKIFLATFNNRMQKNLKKRSKVQAYKIIEVPGSF